MVKCSNNSPCSERSDSPWQTPRSVDAQVLSELVEIPHLHHSGSELARLFNQLREEHEALRECLIAAGVVKESTLSTYLHRRRFASICRTSPFDHDKKLIDVVHINPLIVRFVGTFEARCLMAASQRLSQATKQVANLQKHSSATLFLAGGRAEEAYLKGIKYLSTAESSWNALAPLSVPRCDAVGAVLNGHIYVCGGHNRAKVLHSAERLDLVRMSWERMPPMLEARSGAVAGVLQGRLFVSGGRGTRAFDSCLDTSEFFDTEALEWHAMRSMQIARHGAVSAVANNNLYIIGGFDGRRRLASAESFDPTTSQWLVQPPMAAPCHRAAGIALVGCIYVCGGDRGSEISSTVVECFNTSTRTWSEHVPLQQGRSRAAICSSGDCIYILGGVNNEDLKLASAELFDPSTMCWKSIPALPGARIGAVAFSLRASR